MAYKLLPSECSFITCGDCENICPNKAITGEIDPDRCNECVGVFTAPRCVEICPVDAFVPDPEYRETKEQLLEKWYRLHPGKKPRPGTY